MISTTFGYERPATIEEAVAVLERSGEAKVLAGGHSLIPLMKLGLAEPKTIVDLGRIVALRGIRREGDQVTIGALTTHQAVADDEGCRSALGALAEAAGAIGDLQVRARGTIGGSLAHADPAADEPAAILALEGTLRLFGPRGDRTVPAREFFRGAFETALAPSEILAEVRVTPPGPRSGSAYEKFRHPASGFAVVGVAAVVSLGGKGAIERAAIGVTGAAEAPFRAQAAERALVGTRGETADVAKAAAKIADGVTLLGDLVASADFRAQLLAVHARRAIERAVAAART
jgi:carbon-monoxide dehydrogenase medium subunit